MRMWVKDPITKQPSVSLTLLILSTVLMVSFTLLEAFHATKSSSLLDELFLTSVSLYFGRRVSFRAGGAVGESVANNVDSAADKAK